MDPKTKYYSAVQLKLLAIAILLVAGGMSIGAESDSLEKAKQRAEEAYREAKFEYFSNTGNTTSAWMLARACFDWAEFATNDSQRASVANEGIASAKFVTEMRPRSAAGHYYLALNLGQLARTKSLGALKLVREMEKEFLAAIAADPKFDNAGAVRSLGMLYLEAPGWPASIGNKSKARQYLERSVELAPAYPENHIVLMEAQIRWEEPEALAASMERYGGVLSEAKEKFEGPEWEHSWQDWTRRWKEISGKAREN